MKRRHDHESDGGSDVDADIGLHPQKAATGTEQRVRGPPRQLNSDEDDELDKDFGLDGGANARNKGKKGKRLKNIFFNWTIFHSTTLFWTNSI